MSGSMDAGKSEEETLKVLVVDDEPLALGDALDCVADVDPAAQARGVSSPEAALEWAREHAFHLALLDIEMPGMSGLELAERLFEINPRARIVFVTSFDDYALKAFSVHAHGYLLKPLETKALAYEMAAARDNAFGAIQSGRALQDSLARSSDSASSKTPALLRAVTFGGFEVYCHDEPLRFKRARAKELLALLIDRRGVGLTLREILAVLWPDDPYDNAKRSYYQNIVSSLRSTLRAAGAEEVLVKSWNSLAIDAALIDCDLYRFLEGDLGARAAYRHEYLPQYEWGEFTAGLLDRRLQEG